MVSVCHRSRRSDGSALVAAIIFNALSGRSRRVSTIFCSEACRRAQELQPFRVIEARIRFQPLDREAPCPLCGVPPSSRAVFLHHFSRQRSPACRRIPVHRRLRTLPLPSCRLLGDRRARLESRRSVFFSGLRSSRSFSILRAGSLQGRPLALTSLAG